MWCMKVWFHIPHMNVKCHMSTSHLDSLLCASSQHTHAMWHIWVSHLDSFICVTSYHTHILRQHIIFSVCTCTWIFWNSGIKLTFTEEIICFVNVFVHKYQWAPWHYALIFRQKGMFCTCICIWILYVSIHHAHLIQYGGEVGGWGRVPLERWGAGVEYH